MINRKAYSALFQRLLKLVMGLVACTATLTHAATIWTGPPLNYTQPGTNATEAANQDRLTPGVWLTRAGTQGLFNAKTETIFTGFSSPADTEWANGTTANYASLSYTNWNEWAKVVNGGPPNTVGTNAVLHLISEDIYLAITFTAWGGSLTGGFSYIRSTPEVASPTPTVVVTNPVNGAVFAEPANLNIVTATTVSSGAVTNVAFFGNNILLGSDQSAPFNFTTGNLAAGAYFLTAVATAAGVSATSAVVNVTVVSPVVTTLSSPQVSNNEFTFDYTANPGLAYVIENSSNLVNNWLPLVTNVAAASPVHFTNGFLPNSSRFYRVGRLPNP